MQKTTEEEENIFLSGFPIKNFGNDERGRWIPECIYQGSKLFKGKKHIPTSSSPRQSSSRGPEVFKSIWMPDKKFQAWQKEKPSEGEGRFRELAGRALGWINYKGTAPPHKPPERRKDENTKRQKKKIKNNMEEKISVFVTPRGLHHHQVPHSWMVLRGV